LPEEVFSSPCGIKLAMLRAERAYRAALAETTLDLHQRPQST
jgi:DNA-binding IscR family transcriptional regulator